MIDEWLNIVKKARRLKQYQEWCFIVGSSGSLEERIELGEKALELLGPKSNWIILGSSLADDTPHTEYIEDGQV